MTDEASKLALFDLNNSGMMRIGCLFDLSGFLNCLIDPEPTLIAALHARQMPAIAC
jgi:hypothetical protein